MRSETEIREALECIDNHGLSMNDRSDTFKWGRYWGRQEALEWVLGNIEGNQISLNQDFSEWLGDMRDDAGPLRK